MAQARPLHNCLDDPAQASVGARLSQAQAGQLFRGPSNTVPPAPRPLYYRLLPPVTLRRYLRPKVKLGKQALFSHSHHRLRPELYKPLPEGWEWPPPPFISDLPHPKRKRKRKRRIPQEVLDEYARWAQPRPATAGLPLTSAATPSTTQPDRQRVLEEDANALDVDMEELENDSAEGEVDLGDDYDSDLDGPPEPRSAPLE